MKKVIIPFDGSRFSEGAFSFAITLNNRRPILLTGIFLSQVDFSRFFLFPAALTDASVLLEKNAEEENIKKNIERFTSLCQKNNIECRIHEDLYDFALPELTKESRFADLLIIGSEIYFKNISENDYNIFLKDTLQHTECPVMVVPEKFHLPTQNILAYDGSTSSVFAIKQFAYLFPDLCDNKTILVYAAEETEEIPAEVNIEELAASHFSNLAITVLNSSHKENLTEWVLKRENSLLISGSFGRSGFSSQFTKSFVINIIDAHKIPVFIAHQ
jgi:nucleotide-binding universal stress UspA family protein